MLLYQFICVGWNMNIQMYFQILNDPISYLHHQRLGFHPEVYNTPLSRTYINEFIIDYYGLDVNLPPEVLIHPTVNLWVKNWYLFPYITYLIGCCLLSNSLLWRGYIFTQPEWVAEFITSDYFTKNNHSEPRVIPDEFRITSTGYQGLSIWIESLPEQLKMRFELMFPEDIIGYDVNGSVDRITLTKVFDYVKKNYAELSHSSYQ